MKTEKKVVALTHARKKSIYDFWSVTSVKKKCKEYIMSFEIETKPKYVCKQKKKTDNKTMTNEMKKLFNDHSCWLKRITVRL
jgi:hypothetical protein